MSPIDSAGPEAPSSLDAPVEAGGDRPKRRWLPLLLGVLCLLVWALVCDLVLETSLWWGREDAPWGASFTTGPGPWLGSLVLLLVLLLLWSLTNRLWLSMGLLLSVAGVLAVANQAKLEVRREPLYPSDLEFVAQPSFLMEMTTPGTLVLAAFLVVLVVVGSILLGRFLGRRFRRPRRADEPRWWWSLLVTRVLVGCLCALALFDTTQFNEPGNLWRETYEAQGAHWKVYHQDLNYARNGFVGGVLFNMPTQAMSTPPGYSREAMLEIADRYSDGPPSGPPPIPGLDDMNVVLVLSESFSDPTALEGFDLGEDPLPLTRELMSATSSGQMLAQLYGGGTANMEFEALTGQSLTLFEPQLTTPYQMLVPDYAHYPSAVGWFEHHGYRTVAVHPYTTALYKRVQVYESLGFDEFVHDTTLQESERIEDSEYISDESAFDEVRYQIEQSSEPLMAHLVSMQNHFPFRGSYDDPIGVASDLSRAQSAVIGQYARGLEYTDTALDDFLQQLEDDDEQTAVVFYGDHQPGLYEEEVLDQNPGRAMYQTPFFLWSTLGNTPDELPVTSPIQFLPLLFEKLGRPLPPYYALLAELRTEITAMEQGRFITATGERVTESELNPRARRLLDDLRMVQYDFSVGERYAVDQMWYPQD